jgi:hypothetical protein
MTLHVLFNGVDADPKSVLIRDLPGTAIWGYPRHHHHEARAALRSTPRRDRGVAGISMAVTRVEVSLDAFCAHF